MPPKSASTKSVASAGGLGKQLAAAENKIGSLLARRVGDMQRLEAMTQARDIAETRKTLLLEKLSKEKEKLKTQEKRLEALERRSGSGRFERNQDARSSGNNRLSMTSLWWFRRTIKLAHQAHKERRLVDAQVLFDSALTLKESPSLWIELGHVLREQDLFDGAQAAYERALDLNPNDAETQFLAGFCAEQNDRKNAAAKFYEEAIRVDPKIIEKYDHLRNFNERLFK